jgi:hypothetical protein
MRKFFLISMLSFGFLSAQDSTDFKNFLGITYSPFGQAQIRDNSGFSLGYSNEPELGVYKNEFNMFFTSTFGIKIKKEIFLIFDLNINKGSFLIENKGEGSVTDNSETIEESLTLITPKFGLKFFLNQHKQVAPYLRLAFFKTIALASFKSKNSIVRVDQGYLFEKLNSPFGIEFGVGTEIDIMEQLSFFLDAKFIYQRSSFTLEKKDYTFSEILKIVSFGFNMYY